MLRNRTTRALCFALFFFSVLAIGYLALFQGDRHRVSFKENRRHISVGMCEADVNAVMGLPAGDYRSDKRIVHFFSKIPACGSADRLDREVKSWTSDEEDVMVTFEDGKVVQVICGHSSGPSTFRERVQWKIFLVRDSIR
jgi:hypothetical protein